MRKIKSLGKIRSHGMSIIELVVALVITGIAIAGISEITFINGFWSIQSLNKVDNIYAAKQFLERIGRELRQASAISVGATPNQAISITLPAEITVDANGIPHGSVDGNGYPMKKTTVTYTVVLDPNTPAAPAPTEYLIQASYDGGAPITVLRSLVGPQPISGGVPHIFQYIDKNVDPADPKFGISDSLTTNPASVVINLELRRQDYGVSSTSSTQLSVEGLRSEVFLRGLNGFI